MKNITTACGVLGLGLIFPLIAQVTETTTETDVSRNADGSVTETETTTTRTFDPAVRTKTVEYFDAYKTERFGLPPAWATRIKVEEIPAAWRTTRIEPGIVVEEEHRTHLMPAPPELVKVLPAPSGDVRYYVAGSNVVAVDKTYKVVDSIQIPSVKITVD